MKSEDRIIELLAEMVIRQDQMLLRQDQMVLRQDQMVKNQSETNNKLDEAIHEIKVLQKRTDKNTAAISEIRLSNIRLVDLLEGEVKTRLVRLEKAVFKS